MRFLAAAMTLLAGFGPGLQAQSPPESPPRNESAIPRSIRNPAWLRANEVLERREPGRGLRVRFEWEQVARATGYLLTGRWTDERSWETRSMEVVVTPGNADQWDETIVVIGLQLPPGTHSWSVVAALDGSLGDLANPARHTFEIR